MRAGTGFLRNRLAGLRACGPYILVELLLPGGTLLALLLWLSQRLNGMGSGSVYRYVLAQRYRAAVAAKPYAIASNGCVSPDELLPNA